MNGKRQIKKNEANHPVKKSIRLRKETISPKSNEDRLCPACFEDMTDPDHFGCSYCGSCTCQGEC